MDTSKEYIKMCEKAVEIQEKWQPNVGDWYICHIDEKPINTWHDCDELLICKIWLDDICTSKRVIEAFKKTAIFLPRQDQLQGIARHHKEGWYDSREINNLCLFWNWWRSVEVSSYCHSDDVSMEQLWLAFVMHEKYSKIWNGEDWMLKEQ